MDLSTLLQCCLQVVKNYSLLLAGTCNDYKQDRSEQISLIAGANSTLRANALLQACMDMLLYSVGRVQG